MSAFFVSDACLTKCVTAILLYTDHFGDIKTDIPPAYPPLSQSEGFRVASKAGTEIGKALRAMNAEALRQRYPADKFTAEELDYQFPGYPDQDYQFPGYPDERQGRSIALYKALHCLSYQCSEGDVPETNPLYAELDRVIELMEQLDLTPRLSPRHPGWDHAPWGD